MKVAEALESCTGLLREAGVDSPETEAEYLLTSVLGIKRHELYMSPGRPLTAEEEQRLREYAGRRSTGEPAQYVTGVAGFMGFTLEVNAHTLIPRPETEELVGEFLKVVRERGEEVPVVLDLCTGSGCIAVAAAHSLPGARVYATDASEEALEVARRNADRLGVADRVTFLSGDLFAPLEGLALRFDYILSNPPYVASGDLRGLQREVRDFEPAGALDGGPDGLDLIRRIIAGAPHHLASGGTLLMEIGYGQASSVRGLATGSGAYTEIRIKKDLQGIERMLIARPG